MRACGICGTDAALVQMGGMPLGPDGQTASIPLGHEPAGEDVTARLTGLHGHSTNALGAPRPDPDIYIDQAGAAAVASTALRAAKWGARLVTVAVHTKPEPIDLGAMLRSEMTIIASQGYPTEIFEVTPQIAEHQQRFSALISHRVPFTDAGRAFQLALTPAPPKR